MVDIGLLSQVYMNLFSNAVKYTETITGYTGNPRKALAYGVEKIEDFPAARQQGLKLNVFTTGTPLGKTECRQIFTEGYLQETVTISAVPVMAWILSDGLSPFMAERVAAN